MLRSWVLEQRGSLAAAPQRLSDSARLRGQGDDNALEALHLLLQGLDAHVLRSLRRLQIVDPHAQLDQAAELRNLSRQWSGAD